MEVDIEELKEIANNYDVTFATVMRIYQRLKEIPCVEQGDEYQLAECVERVVQGISSNNITKEFQEVTDSPIGQFTTTQNGISDALFHIYGDEAIPYLDEKYREQNEKRFGL